MPPKGIGQLIYQCKSRLANGMELATSSLTVSGRLFSTQILEPLPEPAEGECLRQSTEIDHELDQIMLGGNGKKIGFLQEINIYVISYTTESLNYFDFVFSLPILVLLNALLWAYVCMYVVKASNVLWSHPALWTTITAISVAAHVFATQQRRLYLGRLAY